LEELKPDIVLVEGPPEAEDILQWAVHKELKPPVAILCYQPDDPQRSVFYPFAEFSPEWQAIVFTRQNNLPVRFFDLPIAQQFAIEKAKREEAKKESDDLTSPEHLNQPATEAEEAFDLKNDPISYLAEAAGYEEGEKWWEQMFEYRHNCEQVFEAVTEAMQSLRENLRLKEDKLEKLREAHMRKMIRQAEKELYTTIAVICGAWHAPALISMPKQKEDNDLLKGLPKVKVDCTWIPWTYQRLSYYSGYGAGIQSPGWYEHLWHHPNDDGTRWMARVAQLFRKNGMDTSVAHVIEAVRLAETLASLRGLSKAGLEELNEATLSVLCNGESILLRLIQEELIVSGKIGEVPTDIPKPPLQVDIEKRQKSLRLPPTADFKDYTLDLRKETDLERSIFLHRLRLLEIKWGVQSQVSGKGTFKEQWRLQWDPAFSIDIIEKGSWGTTVEEAANKYVIHQAQETKSLRAVSNYLAEALPAELHSAVEVLIRQLNNLSAASGDVLQLMEAVPSLVNVARYGNVRKTDSELVLQIVSSMITRVCIGLPNAVTGIDEEAAQNLLELVHQLHEAITLLQQDEITPQWQQTLGVIAANQNATPAISGYAARLLSDYKILEGEALIKSFHFRMSSANPPDSSAAWLEGFLKGSGSILLVDHDLWALVNQWIDQLDAASFTQVLPLLRRTFSNFTPLERRKLGEKVKSGGSSTGIRMRQETDLDAERAQKGIPIVMQLLGLKPSLDS
jgi:methyltransferase-like protein